LAVRQRFYDPIYRVGPTVESPELPNLEVLCSPPELELSLEVGIALIGVLERDGDSSPCFTEPLFQVLTGHFEETSVAVLTSLLYAERPLRKREGD
jgi:hypothetical protein